MLRIAANLFWGAVGVAIGLATLYAITRFLRARGGAFSKVGGFVENVTQP